MRKICYIWLICWWVLHLAQAQSSPYGVKLLAFEDGLSHRNTFQLAQDPLGFMWLGTINGINRFDGQQVTHPSVEKGQSMVTSMESHPSGQMLLAMGLEVYIVNTRTQKFTPLPLINILPNGSYLTLDLQWGSQGSIWLLMGSEADQQTLLLEYSPKGGVSIVKTISTYHRNAQLFLQKGTLWAGIGNTLYAYNESGSSIGKYLLPQNEDAIVQLKTWGSQWAVITQQGHVWQMMGGNWSALAEFPADLFDRQVFDALPTSEGDIWWSGSNLLAISSGDKLLYELSPQVRTLTRHTPTFRQLLQDKTGVLWCASDFGAVYLATNYKLFNTYLSGGNERCSNGFCSMRGITEDNKGRIYFAFYNSIQQLDTKTGLSKPILTNRSFSNLPFGIHWKDKAIWTGNGLSIDLKTQQIDTLFKVDNADKGVVMEDSKGDLWFGYEQQIYYHQTSTGKTQRFPHKAWPENAKEDINFMMETPDGSGFYVATQERGVVEIGRNGQLMRAWSMEKTKGFPSNRVLVLSFIDGQLWAGTADGLVALQPNDTQGVLKNVGEKSGLPNSFINGMLAEGDSCLWLSTDNGLVRYAVKSGRVNSFFQPDGLAANEFNRISFYASPSGYLFFGGLNGITAFRPGEEFSKKSKPVPAPLQWTSISTYNRATDSTIYHTENLVALTSMSQKWAERSIGFRFSLLNYAPPSPIFYSFWMEGYEPTWSTPSSNSEVNYSNLPSGKYKFRVRARYGAGPWLEDERAIAVEIKAPFYTTWWFWALCLSVFSAVLYGVLRYRIYQIRKRERTLERLVAVRTQELEAEQSKSDALLLNILPAETAQELKKYGKAKAKYYPETSVLFADIVGFSAISQQLDTETLVRELDRCFQGFDQITLHHGLEKIKTIGDAYMCAAGVPHALPEHAIASVRAALEMQQFAEAMAVDNEKRGLPTFRIRIGIHSGPLVAGIVGLRKFAYDIWGDTVNAAARLETHGETGRVNISEETYQALNGKFQCTLRGTIPVKNRTDIVMYFVEGEV